jgi:hypothetical protein
MERFTYYVIRVKTGPSEGETLTGVVERLASGEKQSFVNGEQLLRLMTTWLDDSNMQGAPKGGNAG